MPVDMGLSSGSSEYTPEQVLLLGERIYRQGILPDGSVVKAFVQGDIPVDGRAFSCVRCHRRSGLGTSEGDIVTLPINAPNLFRPRVLWDPRRRHSQPEIIATGARQVPSFMQATALRPSYTDDSLERAIATGIDSAGRTLNEIMPRYELDADAMKLLIHYLKNLTMNYSPGVSENSLQFATIVTEGVEDADRQAMLSVLNAYIKDKNAQLRNQLRRATNGAFNRREADAAYRMLALSVWELKGSKDSWYAQLEDYYQKQPVFAILGGISADGWEEIHKFSEARGVPALFPITDKPVVTSNDWNTVYFSTGLYQEGETTARFIKRHEKLTGRTRLVHIYDKAGDGAIVARGFDETWEAMNKIGESNYEVVNTGLSLAGLSQAEAGNADNLVVLLWSRLDDESLGEVIGKLHAGGAKMIFLSSRLLGENITGIPDTVRSSVYITYPYSLPGEKDRQLKLLRTWLKIKHIPEIDLTIQSKMYFLGWLLSDVLVGMKSEFYRDYFLERVEMMKDQTLSIAVFPRLSLGPDQRYASKGCYVIQLSEGGDPQLLAKSGWVTH